MDFRAFSIFTVLLHEFFRIKSTVFQHPEPVSRSLFLLAELTPTKAINFFPSFQCIFKTHFHSKLLFLFFIRFSRHDIPH